MLATQNIQLSHRKALTLKTYSRNLVQRDFAFTALRTALIVGSLIFVVNHGEVLLKGQMTRQRWLAAALSYVTPYAVSIYGQSKCQLKYKA
jgi:hypothetical protein